MIGERFVTVHGHRVRMHVRPGTGDGPPLVLANGIGAAMEVLEPFVEVLDPAIEVVRFDVPGVGGSPVPRFPLPFPVLARLLGELLDELGYGRVDVLGISWGGALAQQFAFQNPRRCRRLVLVATATGTLMVPARPAVLAAMVTPRRHQDPVYARRIAGLIYGGSLRAGTADAPLGAHAPPASGRGYLFQLLGSAGWTSLPALPLIRQPTLILAGDDDPLIPLVNAKVMARLLPNARLEVYPDGHLGLLTMAKELATTIKEFLTTP